MIRFLTRLATASLAVIILHCTTPAGGQQFDRTVADATISYADRADGKPFVLTAPGVPLTGKDRERLLAGEPVCRLLDSPGETKYGWMRFVAPCDPVTVWWIVTDNQCFARTSGDYPATGTLFDKRRTFMPYTWENVLCRKGGEKHIYQLLVFPLLSPRKTNVISIHNRNGFPWETAWQEHDPVCEHLADPAFKKWRDKAVVLPRNTGSYRIRPLPKELRTSPEDVNRADVRYFVDTHPGGGVGELPALVNGATKQAMPQMAELIAQHGRDWMAHMKRYHTKEEIAAYEAQRAAYLEVWEKAFAESGE